LHDWRGYFKGSDDGFMMPVYDFATINGKMLGFGKPVLVKQGERVLMNILNSSPTKMHWVALAGHRFRVVALDGNTVPQPQTVSMLRLAPAERVSAVVEMDAPRSWILGEVRRSVQAAGMGIVIEYAGAGGKAVWTRPDALMWSYRQFAASTTTASEESERIRNHSSNELSSDEIYHRTSERHRRYESRP
jgi:FtsP/CotA-like multicopper oxidase with cupredoxin domain